MYEGYDLYYLRLGEALYCLKQYDEAVTCFDKALLIEENENVIIMKGLIYNDSFRGSIIQ